MPDGAGDDIDVSSGENQSAGQVASIAVLNPAVSCCLSVLFVRVFRMQLLVQMEARRANGDSRNASLRWINRSTYSRQNLGLNSGVALQSSDSMIELRRFRIVLRCSASVRCVCLICPICPAAVRSALICIVAADLHSLWRFSGSDLSCLGSVCGFGAGSVVSTYTVITRCGDQ